MLVLIFMNLKILDVDSGEFGIDTLTLGGRLWITGVIFDKHMKNVYIIWYPLDT